MFMRLQTQWVTGGMGSILGLNYPAVEALFRIYKTKNQREIFEGLQVMERAALKAFREKAKKD